MIPELREAIEHMERLNATQLQMIYDYAKNLESLINTLPVNITGNFTQFLKELNDSHILDPLRSPGDADSTSTPKGPKPFSEPFTDRWGECQFDMMAYVTGLATSQEWAKQMLDASGKPGRSILKGNVKFMGNYIQCRDVHHKNPGIFTDLHGNTCRARIKIGANPNFGYSPAIEWDFCLPKSCQSHDLNKVLRQNGVDNVEFTCTPELDISTDPAAIVALIILVIFGLLIVSGTVLDVCLGFQCEKTTNFINAYKDGEISMINGGFELKEKPFVMDKRMAVLNGMNRINGMNGINGKPPMTEHLETEIKPTANYDISDSIHTNGHAPHGLIYPVGPEVPSAASPEVKEESKNTPAKKEDHTESLPRWMRALLAFSWPRNSGKILSVKAGQGNIGCLHGMRVLSLGWVILGHVILTSGMGGNFENTWDVYQLINTLPFQLIINAPFSVDTFFFMSGFLTCYLFMKECGKKGGVTCKQMVLYYVHRYWRLTPPMMMWVMVVATLLKYIGAGRPAWEDFAAAPFCRENWWANLLYINNIYTEGGMCIGVTWFLSNDMQFYILAPLALVPFVYNKKTLGFYFVGLMIATHITANLWLVLEYDFDTLRNGQEYSDKLYFKPYTRVAPFFIGMIFGWILYKAKGKVTMNKCVVFLGWILAIALACTITLVTYDENKDLQLFDPDGWPAAVKAVYEAFSRPLWAVICGWIVLACASGYGGFINSILSWEGFLPLSRLTFSAYLVHMSIIQYESIMAETTFMYTTTILVYRFLGFYAISYIVAYVMAVVVEAPMLGLEKVALK